MSQVDVYSHEGLEGLEGLKGLRWSTYCRGTVEKAAEVSPLGYERNEENMDVTEAIRTKRAIRRFKDEPLPEDAVEAILNAARRSPTAGNAQYLIYTAVRDKELQAQLADIRQGAAHLGNAPIVVAIVAQTGKWSDSIIHFDSGQAAAYMMLQAWSLGIGSNVTWFGGESTAGEVLNLPAGTRCEWAISFGYPEDETAISAPMKPGERKPLEEVVRWGRWE